MIIKTVNFLCLNDKEHIEKAIRHRLNKTVLLCKNADIPAAR